MTSSGSDYKSARFDVDLLLQLSSPDAFARTWISIHIPTLPMIRGMSRRALREAALRSLVTVHEPISFTVRETK
jgi:hypothetical protein